MAAHSIAGKLAVIMIVLAFAETAKASSYGVICGVAAEDLLSCRPAVAGPAALPPSAACCAALKGADMPCMCTFKSNKFLPAMGIDPALAMQLPAKCNLQYFHC